MGNAMEKMVAQMLGFTPEQMHETLAGIQGLANDVQARLFRIEEKQERILEMMEGRENVERTEHGNGSGQSDGGNTISGTDLDNTLGRNVIGG